MALKKGLKKKTVKRAVKKPARKPAKKPVRKAVKKTLKKKIIKKKPAAGRKSAPKKTKKGEIGIVTHYFPHVQAAVIKLKAPMSVGDTIKIKGHTTDLIQNVGSIQVDHAPVNTAKKGDEVGVRVESRVRQHDLVYKG